VDEKHGQGKVRGLCAGVYTLMCVAWVCTLVSVCVYMYVCAVFARVAREALSSESALKKSGWILLESEKECSYEGSKCKGPRAGVVLVCWSN
jgi:hypothetical protein